MATSTSRYAASQAAFARACAILPGGVNSPVRAYKAVGQHPIFIAQGHGAHVTDLDGQRYIDYVMSYGPLILGHAHPQVIDAIQQAATRGCSFGMPTQAETLLAEKVRDAVPSMEMVRFVNSGTEAAMSAIRLARAATGKRKIIKCTGCYHGHSDALLVEAGSGATTLGIPSSPGVPSDVVGHTLLVPFNDLSAVERMMQTHAGDVAAMAVEPVAGNMGCVPPAHGYLQGLRKLCDDYGVLLLFDEVMTGFRVAWGGAQALYGVQPDLTCLGKIIGGGLPCAAYGGRAELMKQVAPSGPMYQAGTLSGNPLAMAAGLATLEILQRENPYPTLQLRSQQLAQSLRDAAAKHHMPVQVTQLGSMMTVFFSPENSPHGVSSLVSDYESAKRCDTKRFARFFHGLLERGVVLPPSQFEAWFVSVAHDESTIRTTVAAADEVFHSLQH